MPDLAPASVGDRKTVVFEILRTHLGPAQAITADEIGQSVGITARDVRALIAELIVIDGHGEICANTGGEAFPGAPKGYFWATCAGEVETYRNVLISRLQELRKREHAAWHTIQRMPRGRNTQPRLIP